MRSTTLMMLAPGWRCMLTTTAGERFIHASLLGVLCAVDDGGHVAAGAPERHAVGNDHIFIVIAGKQLVIRRDGEGLPLIFQNAFGLIDVRLTQHGAQVSRLSP